MRRIACLLCWLLPSVAVAGSVYSWTDDNGKVHFSSQPPPEAAGKEAVVAQTPAEPDPELKPLDRVLTRGTWEGERDGWQVAIAFHANGHFVESLRGPVGHGGGRNFGSYVGAWRFEHRMIELSGVRIYQPGAEQLPPPEALTIEYYRGGVMKVIHANGQPAYYRKSSGSYRLQLPAELK